MAVGGACDGCLKRELRGVRKVESRLTMSQGVTERIRSFFAGLEGIVGVATGVQQELDRRFAPGFNPVDLIRYEVGWSALLAMLLHPAGRHGQGRLFLDLFLAQIKVEPSSFDGRV